MKKNKSRNTNSITDAFYFFCIYPDLENNGLKYVEG